MWYGLREHKIPWIRWSCSKFVAFKALSTFSSKEFMAMIIICPEVMDPVLLFKVWIKSRNDFSASGWLMMSLICLAACSIAPSSRWQFFKPVKPKWKTYGLLGTKITSNLFSIGYFLWVLVNWTKVFGFILVVFHDREYDRVKLFFGPNLSFV